MISFPLGRHVSPVLGASNPVSYFNSVRAKRAGRQDLNELVSGYPAYPAAWYDLFQSCHSSLALLLSIRFASQVLEIADGDGEESDKAQGGARIHPQRRPEAEDLPADRRQWVEDYNSVSHFSCLLVRQIEVSQCL